ncbi:MAG: FtsX-like permease family protein, partial [Chloroflexota bacterium]
MQSSSFILLPSYFRKVWRDLWNNKGRTLLVVVSIAVGVMALGMITASNTIVSGQMIASQEASHPAHVVLGFHGLVDEATVRSIARLPEVAEAEGFSGVGIRWKPALDAEWQDADLTMRGDYENQIFDLIQLRGGVWPDARRVAVEFDQMSPYGVPPVGGTIYFEVNNRPKAVILGGIVRDPHQFPPPFTNQPGFYVSRSMMAELVGWSDFSAIRFTVPQYSKAKAEAAADAVKDKLLKIGVSSGVPFVQDPQRHYLQDMMDGVGLVLAVMAVMSLGMSMILVINTMNAIVAQQVPQIGIMKTVGGLRDQIATLYLVGVAVYGLLSLMIAVPLGGLGGDALARWMLAFINVPAPPFGLLRQSFVYQVGAGLVTPLFAALWPVLQGVAISVREALAAYGIGTGHYGGRLLDKLVSGVQGLPRMAALALRNTFRRAGRAALTQITLTTAGAIFMMVVSTHYSFNRTIDQIFHSFGFDVLIGFEQTQRIDEVVPLIESRTGVERAEMWIFRNAAIKKPGAEPTARLFISDA